MPVMLNPEVGPVIRTKLLLPILILLLSPLIAVKELIRIATSPLTSSFVAGVAALIPKPWENKECEATEIMIRNIKRRTILKVTDIGFIEYEFVCIRGVRVYSKGAKCLHVK